MTRDDYHVILYKVLAYMYACLKEGVNPRIEKAYELVDVNEAYWNKVVMMMCKNGYIEGIYIASHLDAKGKMWYPNKDLGITEKGIDYLRENSTMKKVAELLGDAFKMILETAVKATGLL